MSKTKDDYSVLKVTDIMKKLNIGRDRAYALLKSPCFPSIKIGRTYFVTDDKFEEWLNDYAGKEFRI